MSSSKGSVGSKGKEILKHFSAYNHLVCFVAVCRIVVILVIVVIIVVLLDVAR